MTVAKKGLWFYRTLLLCCLGTLAALWAHELLPPRVWVVVPSAEGVEGRIYSDGNVGGASQVEWLDEQQLAWRCTISSESKHPFCGYHIYFGNDGLGVDMTRFERIVMRLSYSGGHEKDRLRVYLRNHEPNFSERHNMETAKFNVVQIASHHFEAEVVIPFDEFFVAEWWINNYDVPRELVTPQFGNVVAFGVDLFYPPPPGIYDLRLEKLELVGLWVSAEQWYLAILLFWVAVIMVLGAVNLVQLRRAMGQERRRVAKLADYNSLLRRESDEYKELSMRDHLTGLLNRHGLSAYTEQHFPRREGHPALALVVIDLDHFKPVNDNLGHEAGDCVLKALGQLLQEHTRQTDWVCRWGGEEFALLLPGTPLDDALRLSEKLRLRIAQAVFPGYADLRITASMGVGEAHLGEAFPMFFARVDAALYQAKTGGRNCVVSAG